MARINKLYEKPRATTIGTNDLLTIGAYQSDGSYKVETISKADARASLLEPISVTYAELTTLVNNSDLEVGAWYKITNATSANFNLYVQAIAVNKIGCDAKDPLYPNDVVKYNFASNVITWRWDTVNDISAGEDWRNSNNISIGTGCTRISIGQGCSNITIGQDCSNVTIGSQCVDINLFAECNNLIFEDICNGITLSEQCIKKKFTIGIEAYNFATGTNIYNVTAYAEVRLTAAGTCRMNYYDGSNNFVSVAP